MRAGQTTARISTEADIPLVSRLFQEGMRTYYGLLGNELPTLIAGGHASVVVAQSDIRGAVVVGPVVRATAWLRGVALRGGWGQSQMLELLLSSLPKIAQSHRIERLFCSCDETTDGWLLKALRRHGYVHDTYVQAYEKTTMNIPSLGNWTVTVRPATPSDREAVTTLDQLCFDPQWVKQESFLEAAMVGDTIFLVAQLESRIVGYAYASVHLDGQLIHLTRLAVAPSWRGQRIGVRLLAEVVRIAHRRRTRVMTLNTQSDNLIAQRIYRWFGFAPTGERHEVVRYDLPVNATSYEMSA